MKRAILIAMLLMIGHAGVVYATTFVEEYNGYQSVKEGQSYSFGFDMWFSNSEFDVTTDSNLNLTSDAAGAFGDWDSATVYVDLYSSDWAKETSNFTLTAWDTSGDIDFNLGTFTFNALDFFGLTEATRTFSFDLNNIQIDAFDNEGWGNLTITASLTNCWNYNDFGIEKVGMAVNSTAPVPEPATMILFGTGIAGLVGSQRKKRR